MGLLISPSAKPRVSTAPAPRAMARSVLGEVWLVYRRAVGPAIELTCTRAVTAALRGAMLRRAPQPPLEVLSGHTSDGCASERPHVAFVVLPSLGPPGAAWPGALCAGSIAGVALLVPHGLDAREHRHLDAAVAPPRERPLRLRMGRLGAWRLAPTIFPPADPGLRPATWLGPAHRWHTVTPIALDRFPGRLFSADASAQARARDCAAKIIAQSCVHLGLPAPARVRVSTDSAVPGAPASPRFPRFSIGARPRVLIHAEIRFDELVCGPVLVGAGRYVGLGLCLPCDHAPQPRSEP